MNTEIAVVASLALVAGMLSGCDRGESAALPYFFAVRVSDAEAAFDEAQFRSFRKDGRLATHVAMDDVESRFALVPPLPSRLTYRLTLGVEPELRFSIGVSTFGTDALTAPADFRVLVDDGTTETLVFEETVPRRFPNRWFEHEVDLGEWSGRAVALSFETRLRRTEFTRTSSRLAGSGESLLAAWGNPLLEDGASRRARPNLVLVSIDCLRADHVGVYGYEANTTPHLDRFAEDGVVFERAYAVSSWTLPTHMSMLTGLMPTRHGLTRSRKRNPAAPYLPDLLTGARYETLGVVSALYLTPTFGFQEGFDVYQARIDAPAAELVDAALELLLHAPHRERFLFLHLFDAHWPYLPPGRFLDGVERSVDVSDALKKVIKGAPPEGEDEIETLRGLYAAEIAYIDSELGRFFEELRRAGLYDESLIVVTSDHGEAFFEHGLWQHSNVAYDEVLHIPMIVKWPSSSKGRSDAVVSQLHVFPTLLGGAGLPSPHPEESLAGLVEGGGTGEAMSEITWEANARRGAIMKIVVRREAEKYIGTFAGDRGDETMLTRVEREELYDLSRDPKERVNLLERGSANASVYRKTTRAFLDEVRERREGQRGGRIVLDEELKERLEALGYVDP